MNTQTIVESGRESLLDKKFDVDVENAKYINKLFLRLVAKNKTFRNVDFKYSIFDTCYLRGCRFDSCDFTGVRFLASNFHGATFSGCKFDYALFERTWLEPEILETECPATENLKARFARTLRTNFQQIGDIKGVNRAATVEIRATEEHLYKIWASNEAYYRRKYSGWRRFRGLVEWQGFVLLGLFWGNGESVWRLLRSVLVIVMLIAFWDVVTRGDPLDLREYLAAFGTALAVFIGVIPDGYPKAIAAVATFLRLVTIGCFLTIFVKRFSRR